MPVIKRKFNFEKILTIIVWAIFLISLIRMCVAYNTLPIEIGVHFAADGSFDVIADKKFAWYPYVLSAIILVVCELSAWGVEKIKTGLRVSREGEEQLKGVVRFFLNILKMCTVVFFSGIWADCVIEQQDLNTMVAGGLSIIYFLSIIALLIAVVVIRIRKRGRLE